MTYPHNRIRSHRNNTHLYTYDNHKTKHNNNNNNNNNSSIRITHNTQTTATTITNRVIPPVMVEGIVRGRDMTIRAMEEEEALWNPHISTHHHRNHHHREEDEGGGGGGGGLLRAGRGEAEEAACDHDDTLSTLGLQLGLLGGRGRQEGGMTSVQFGDALAATLFESLLTEGCEEVMTTLDDVVDDIVAYELQIDKSEI